MNTVNDYLTKDIMSEAASELDAWIGSDDFKKRVEEELGMPWDEIEARMKAKIEHDPQAVEKAVGLAFEKLFGK